MLDSNLLAAGGDIEILSVKLINYKGISLDISVIFTEIELYEDLFNHSLSGNITLNDSNNLIKAFPIIGEEQLELVYKTPGLPVDFKVSLRFMIYKLSNIIAPTLHKQIYTLHFITQETLLDLNKKSSRAYSGTADKIIERLLKSEGLNTSKKYELEQSSNNIKFVSPYWTPFKCINYTMSRAQTDDKFKSSAFVFFETTKGYKFKSLNSIMDKSNVPKIAYKYNNDFAREGDKNTSKRVASEMTKIYTLYIDERFNMIDRLESGVYSHFVWNHNILLKTIDKHRYSFEEDFNKTNHLEQYKPSSDSLIYATNNAMSTITTYPQVHNGIAEDNYAKIQTNKMPLMSQLEMFQMDITVNGRSDLQVGDLLDITVGGMEIINAADKNKPLDDRYDGRYIAVSILHRITKQKHAMVIRVARESVKEKY